MKPAVTNSAAQRHASSQSPAKRKTGLWKRGLVWLLVLGPFFFIIYGFSNKITGVRSDI